MVAPGDGAAHGNVISRHSHGDKVALFVCICGGIHGDESAHGDLVARGDVEVHEQSSGGSLEIVYDDL